MRFVKVCAAALLVAALPFTSQAQSGPGMMGPGGSMMGQPHKDMGPAMGQTPRPFAGVQFNEEQRKRIQDMMAKEREAHQGRVAKMQEFQKQLREQYMADKWDAKAITKLYEKMHAEQRKTIAAMAEARNKVFELMTKEQREQMKKHQQEQMKRFSAPRPQQ